MSVICDLHSIDSNTYKLLKSLDCLLNENFTIQDKTLLEKLLTSLHNADALLQTIPITMHCKWFSNVMDIYRQQTPMSKNSSVHLYAFALKYLAVLVRSNDGLIALIETRTLPSMISCIDVKSNLKESSIFNAYMSLLLMLNTHKQGLEYIFQEGLWKNILFAIHGLTAPAKYIEIHSSQYIVDLIYKSIEFEIPQHYWEPIVKELFFKLRSIDTLTDQQDFKEFFAYNVCMKTLIMFLEKCVGTKYELFVRKNIVEKYALSEVLVSIYKQLNVTTILLKNYVTLHLLHDCFTIWHHTDVKFILKSIFSLMNVPNSLLLYRQINNLCIQAIRYANISNTQLKVNAVFEKELIIGQLIPLKKCIEWLKCSNFEQIQFDNSCVSESEFILNYSNDMDSMVIDIAISSLLNLIDIVPSLKQKSLDCLVNFFSTSTDQFLNSNYWLEHQDQNSIHNKFLEILSYIFICWSEVLEYKLINNVPHDSLPVPLVHRHSEFFNKTSHTSTLLQNGLKLICTALSKRIYESVSCNDNFIAFEGLCTSLTNLLLDTRPEIRDSCLQCISSITVASSCDSEIGHVFINLILKKEMSLAVLNTLKYDNDPFVRAKALECLEKLVSVSYIWEASLKKTDLLSHCLNLMQYESEGIIRRQIVKLITALFIHNELDNELYSEMCVVMVHISNKDPLWEVKIFTYEFWNYVIKKFISKPNEVNDIKALNENLTKLSISGCIHVLYVALKEEHDLVVQKKAICLTKELLVSINALNNTPDFDMKIKRIPLNCSNSYNENLGNCASSIQKKSRYVDSADRILNSITTLNDCELLPSIKSVNCSNIYPNDICLRQKTDDYTSINDFLEFTSTYDFEDCDKKTQWVISTRSGLSSMLDDIIGQSQNCFIAGAELIDCH